MYKKCTNETLSLCFVCFLRLQSYLCNVILYFMYNKLDDFSLENVLALKRADYVIDDINEVRGKLFTS